MNRKKRIIVGALLVAMIVGTAIMVMTTQNSEISIVEPSPTSTASPTAEPTPTINPTAQPTEKPQVTPTPNPTETPQEEIQPTENPVIEPISTVEPTPKPTLESIPQATPEPPQATNTGLTDEENYWLVMLERGCSHCGTNICGGFDYANKTYNSANCDAANSLCDTCGKEIGNGQNGTCIIRESGTCYYCGAEFDGTCHTCP